MIVLVQVYDLKRDEDNELKQDLLVKTDSSHNVSGRGEYVSVKVSSAVMSTPLSTPHGLWDNVNSDQLQRRSDDIILCQDHQTVSALVCFDPRAHALTITITSYYVRNGTFYG